MLTLKRVKEFLYDHEYEDLLKLRERREKIREQVREIAKLEKRIVARATSRAERGWKWK